MRSCPVVLVEGVRAELAELQASFTDLSDAYAKQSQIIASRDATIAEKNSSIIHFSARVHSQESTIAELRLRLQKATGDEGVQLFVKTLTGKTISINNVYLDSTAVAVKAKVLEKEGIPMIMQCLIFEGRQLADDRALAYSNVQEGSTLHLTLRLLSQKQTPCLSPSVKKLRVCETDPPHVKQEPELRTRPEPAGADSDSGSSSDSDSDMDLDSVSD